MLFHRAMSLWSSAFDYIMRPKMIKAILKKIEICMMLTMIRNSLAFILKKHVLEKRGNYEAC